MRHEQILCAVRAVWVILPNLTFSSTALSLSFLLWCPSVHCSTPCPALWQPCQAHVWLHHVRRWEVVRSYVEPPGPRRVSSGLSLSFSFSLCLSGWLQVRASQNHPAPGPPDLAAARGAHAHKLPSWFTDIVRRQSCSRISGWVCCRSPRTPSICHQAHWFLQRSALSFTQCGFYVSADGRRGSNLLAKSLFFFLLSLPLVNELFFSARNQRQRGQEDPYWERPAHHSSWEPGWRR